MLWCLRWLSRLDWTLNSSPTHTPPPKITPQHFYWALCVSLFTDYNFTRGLCKPHRGWKTVWLEIAKHGQVCAFKLQVVSLWKELRNKLPWPRRTSQGRCFNNDRPVQFFRVLRQPRRSSLRDTRGILPTSLVVTFFKSLTVYGFLSFLPEVSPCSLEVLTVVPKHNCLCACSRVSAAQ